MPIAYCEECDWEHRSDESSAELNQAMVEHYVETGHSVEQHEGDERPSFELEF